METKNDKTATTAKWWRIIFHATTLETDKKKGIRIRELGGESREPVFVIQIDIQLMVRKQQWVYRFDLGVNRTDSQSPLVFSKRLDEKREDGFTMWNRKE